MTLNSAGTVALARSAGHVRRLLSIAVTFLAVILAAERLGYAGAYRHAASAGSILLQLVFASPAILYLTGLWQLRMAAAAVAAGTPFGVAVVRASTGRATCLIGGAALSLAMAWRMPSCGIITRD